MAIRFRARLRFQSGSGMAQWVADQMAVRLGQAFHLREGTPNQELSHVTVSGDDVDIDVFWPDDREDLAVDTRNTLQAVIPFLRPAEGRAVSWMDWHRCGHDQEPPELCPEPEWRWSQERSNGR